MIYNSVIKEVRNALRLNDTRDTANSQSIYKLLCVPSRAKPTQLKHSGRQLLHTYNSVIKYLPLYEERVGTLIDVEV